MAIWYLARNKTRIPRRLIYVVDRRVVVDQATTEAENIRCRSGNDQLCISTLRGQHIDNREWQADPAAPAIIVGTVDMIGSRLLFSGYGVSRNLRPYHAGLLGADALVVLDEAHLVPPFEKLLETIANGTEEFGPQRHEGRKIVPPFKLLALSATSRIEEEHRKQDTIFGIEEEDRKNDIVKQRLEARKQLRLTELDDEKALVPRLVERACSLASGPARVLVYCNSRKDAREVKTQIDKQFKKNRHASELLVGGRRVFEREKLRNWLQTQGFLNRATPLPTQPTFLIATSAGEVGIDLDADHIVCDLVEWERMVQRLGRVNRRGEGDARVEVVAAPRKKEKNEEWKNRLERLRKPLEKLRPVDPYDAERDRDASPGAILELRKRAEKDQLLQAAIEDAMTKPPLRPALTRALIDAWSMTSLKEHTGRPDDIQPWLRGWEKDQAPETTVVWRRYLPIRRKGEAATEKEIEAFFKAAPPHTSEKLETGLNEVFTWLKERAKKAFADESQDEADDTSLKRDDVIAYALSHAMDWKHTLYGSDLMDSGGGGEKKKKAGEELKKKLAGSTLVMDVRFCGLSEDGMLEPKAGELPRTIDDGQRWLDQENDDKPTVHFRVRYIGAGEAPDSDGKDVGIHTELQHWQESHRFEIEKTNEGEARCWLRVEKWRSNSATEKGRAVGPPQYLEEHHDSAAEKARKLAKTLKLPEDYVAMLATAAGLHDAGKSHWRWQRAFNAPNDGKVYAKTKGPISVRQLDGYRHEFGSLPRAQGDQQFNALPDDLQDLALHLIAAHHGRGRPVIPTNGCEEAPSSLEQRARDVALRFARLQKQWGPWGLAWLESLLRAADWQASRANDKNPK